MSGLVEQRSKDGNFVVRVLLGLVVEEAHDGVKVVGLVVQGWKLETFERVLLYLLYGFNEGNAAIDEDDDAESITGMSYVGLLNGDEW